MEFKTKTRKKRNLVRGGLLLAPSRSKLQEEDGVCTLGARLKPVIGHYKYAWADTERQPWRILKFARAGTEHQLADLIIVLG